MRASHGLVIVAAAVATVYLTRSPRAPGPTRASVREVSSRARAPVEAPASMPSSARGAPAPLRGWADARARELGAARSAIDEVVLADLHRRDQHLEDCLGESSRDADVTLRLVADVELSSTRMTVRNWQLGEATGAELDDDAATCLVGALGPGLDVARPAGLTEAARGLHVLTYRIPAR